MAAQANRHIVLLGGGHTHSLVIKAWGKNPEPGASMALVSRDELTPYSGMLPGYVAGHYTRDQTHIDLRELCQWANVEFIEATATGLDLKNKKIRLDGDKNVSYDILSVDTGSTPDIASIPGAAQHSIPVKPVHRFEEKWHALQARVSSSRNPAIASDQPTNNTPTESSKKLAIGLVGAGVGGFELLLAIDHAMNSTETQVELHWIVRSTPLRQQPLKVSIWALAVCKKRGIHVHMGFSASEVSESAIKSDDGREILLDEILWVTAANAPKWPSESGLNTDDRGFIKVNSTLQSVSHKEVFAAGDIASLPSPGVAKAGVFAVRQAPMLLENLRHAVNDEPLNDYVPQKQFLTLISLGNTSAIASRNGFAIKGRWVWKWKDYIDKEFMNRFTNLL